jgi:hypothetical protein
MTASLDGPNAAEARPLLQCSQKSTCIRSQRRFRTFSVFVLAFFLYLTTVVSAASVSLSDSQDSFRLPTKDVPIAREVPKKAPLLNVLQAATPVKVPEDTSCTLKLMEHSFGWSYDKPFIGQ